MAEVKAARRPLLSQDFVAEKKRETIARAVAIGAQREGLCAQTTDAIARQARVGKGTLYELFGSRPRCIEYACQLATTQLIEPLAEAADADVSQGERAQRTVDALIGAASADPEMAELCLAHSPAAPVADPHRFERAVVDATWRSLGGDRTAELTATTIVSQVRMRLARGEGERLGKLRKGLIGIAAG